LSAAKSIAALVNVPIGNDSFWRGAAARVRAAKQVSPQNEFFT
jgi:hypothetical protein